MINRNETQPTYIGSKCRYHMKVFPSSPLPWSGDERFGDEAVAHFSIVVSFSMKESGRDLHVESIRTKP